MAVFVMVVEGEPSELLSAAVGVFGRRAIAVEDRGRAVMRSRRQELLDTADIN